MKNKRGYDEIYILVAIVIGILILFLSLYFLFQEYFSSEDINNEVCRESILLRSSLPEATLSGFTLQSFKDKYPLRCKTKVIHINKKNFDHAGEIISKEMASCWALFNNGDVNPFPSQLFGGHTYCFPCARIHFDDDIQEQIYSKKMEALYDQIELINTYFNLKEKLDSLNLAQTSRTALEKALAENKEQLKKELKLSSINDEILKKTKEKLYDEFYKEGQKQDRKIKENFNILYALKNNKLQQTSYWNYLKKSGKYYEPFNPGFANPFKFGDYFAVESPILNFWQKQGLQGLEQSVTTKITTKKDGSVGFANVTLPEDISRDVFSSQKKDMVIVYGTYVHNSKFNFGLNHIPYLFYYIPDETKLPSGETIDLASLNIQYSPFVIPSTTTWGVIKNLGPKVLLLVPIPGSRLVPVAFFAIKQGVLSYYELSKFKKQRDGIEKKFPSICDSWVGVPA